MATTTNTVELYQIINSEHGDPHHILGAHEEKISNHNVIAVRAFFPPANSVSVRDYNDPTTWYQMSKIHESGFFEMILVNKKEWFRPVYKVTGFNNTSWEVIDPYSFAPVISELDLHLFGQGTHYQIFDKLGAHPCEVDGIYGTLFAVWAPNAKRVSVVSDFNSWDGRRNPMRILGGSGIWELFIPGITEYEKYKFEIKTNSNSILLKSDPYANFSEMRPSNASVVFDINKYKWKDSEYLSNRSKVNLNERPINIYEVHLGSWKRKDGNIPLTYSELAHDLIDYVKKMGYTHIELMPLSEYPLDESWGYQVTGYYSPTSRYGTPCELMYLVDKCHENDIGVIMDWVPAHFPKDSHALGRFDGTALYEHQDPRLGEHPDWGTYIFNLGRNEVKNFLIANAIYWIEKYHFDGLRVDAVASMLYLDYGKSDGNWIPNCYGGRENLEAVEFLKHMNSIIHKNFPNVLMIAEESTAWANVSRPAEVGGLGFDLKWNMGWMNDFLRYIEKDCIYRKYHHNDLTFGMVYAYTENFTLVLSHDEVVHGKRSMLEKMPGDQWQKFSNLRVAYGYMMAHPGKKLLFMGGEFGQYSEWNELRSLDWHLLQNDENASLQEYMKDLNHLYKENEAFWKYDFDSRGFEWINCSDYTQSLLTFVRKSDSEHLIIACNFTPSPHTSYRMGVLENSSYEEIFNSDKLIYGGSGVVNSNVIKAEPISWDGRDYSIGLKLPPLGFVVLKPISNK